MVSIWVRRKWVFYLHQMYTIIQFLQSCKNNRFDSEQSFHFIFCLVLSFLSSFFCNSLHTYPASICSSWLVVSCCSSSQLGGALFTHDHDVDDDDEEEEEEDDTLIQRKHIWAAEQCAKYYTHPSWKVTPGYFDCIWLLSSPPMRLHASQPHTHTHSNAALQLWFYILVKQNYSLIHNVKSGFPSSGFGYRRLKDMTFRESLCAVMKCYEDLSLSAGSVGTCTTAFRWQNYFKIVFHFE